MEIEQQAVVNEDDYNFLKMMKLTDTNYNKIRKVNKLQLSHNSKNSRQSEINEKINLLYDEIDKEFNNLKANNLSPCFKHNIIKIHNDKTVLQPSLFKSTYIPTKIVDYIKEYAKIVVEYKCDLGNGKNVKVKFILFDSSHYELNNIRKKGASYFKQCVLKIYIWLKVLSKYSHAECGKNLECFIYLTPFKRKLPSCSGFETSSNMYHYADLPENEIDQFVDEWASRLAAGPPIALAQTKRLLNNSLNVTLEEALDDEAAAQTVNFSTSDTAEAMRAFIEKRDPKFTGK